MTVFSQPDIRDRTDSRFTSPRPTLLPTPDRRWGFLARVALGCVWLGCVCVSAGRVAAQQDAAQQDSGAKSPNAANNSAEQETFFESSIRPLLSKHCLECHGPDDQSGELRLDTRADFLRGGASGPLVHPDKPAASLLVRAIGYQDNGLQMPPDGKLADQEIAVLTEWVRRGAFWPKDDQPDQTKAPAEMSFADVIESQRRNHWSYQPIVAVDPPDLADAAQETADQDPDSEIPLQSSAIDRFVMSRLSDANLSMNPRADRRTLIHRAFFTLIGLPPSYEQVQAFINDQRPDAFARLIDRLLDNPHYGERWARHWLDIARYGDTKGYLAGSQETRYPFAFTYRDYVIDAFNDDKPFNEFIIEQIAADQLGLEGSERRNLAAMGFLTVGRRFMNRQPDIIDDQIDVITRGFLGLSVACARCHDHKYDPVPTADYYSLYGVFASSQEPAELPLLGEPESSPEYEAFLNAKAAKQQEVDKWLNERRVATEKELRSKVADYLVFIAQSLPQYRGDKKISLQGKRGPLRPAAVKRWQQFLLDPARSSDPVWNLLRELATIPPEQFVANKPTVLAAYERQNATELSVNDGESSAVPDETGSGDSPAAGDAVTQTLPSDLLNKLRGEDVTSFPEAAQIVGDRLEAAYQTWSDLTATDQEADRLPDPVDESFRRLLFADAAPTTLDAAQMVAHLDQGERNRYNQLRGEVNKVDATHPGAPPRGMVLVDKPRPVEPVIFRRGVPSNRGDRVPRRFLQVLSHIDGGEPFDQGSGRLELAKAIADPQNPLTARVIVNRIWQHHFGEGLVRTPSDFGIRGELPTHPKLLDHLAAEFIASGWSIKQLQRRIMLSATWQQSSELRADANESDPENRLLWHMPRCRLEFEPLRDRLLVAAGRLDTSIGGRSVMIHQDATRRGLYAYIDREDLPGLLASFDLPSPDASQAQRTETTVPQQALYLMNSPFVIQQAKALAERTVADASEPTPEPSPDAAGDATSNVEPANVDPAATAVATEKESAATQRVRRLYRLALSRDPDPAELATATEFVNASSDATIDPWTQLAQVLLLCNEFAFVD